MRVSQHCVQALDNALKPLYQSLIHWYSWSPVDLPGIKQVFQGLNGCLDSTKARSEFGRLQARIHNRHIPMWQRRHSGHSFTPLTASTTNNQYDASNWKVESIWVNVRWKAGAFAVSALEANKYN